MYLKVGSQLKTKITPLIRDSKTIIPSVLRFCGIASYFATIPHIMYPLPVAGLYQTQPLILKLYG